MSEPATRSLGPTCQLCGALVPDETTVCPGCGLPASTSVGAVRVSDEVAPPPARTADIVFAVIVALISLGITLPANVEVTRGVWRGDPYIGIVGLITGIWNLLVWGLPVVVVGRWWYLGARRGDADKTYLWRIYWKSQAATYGLVASLGILLLTICAAAL